MIHLKFVSTFTTLALALGSTVALARSATPARAPVPFDAVSLTIEINATALDAGVILFTDTEERLRHLAIQDPSGRTIYEMTSSDLQGLGLTEISSETAEPDIQTALLAYPEGQYTVTGTAFDGTIVSGVASLSHSAPDAPVLSAPQDGDRLGRHNALIQWELDETVEHYWVEIEQEDPPVNYTIQLQPATHKFKIPAELLLPSTTYQVGVGAVGSNGNATVSEVEFETK